MGRSPSRDASIKPFHDDRVACKPDFGVPKVAMLAPKNWVQGENRLELDAMAIATDDRLRVEDVLKEWLRSGLPWHYPGWLASQLSAT